MQRSSSGRGLLLLLLFVCVLVVGCSGSAGPTPGSTPSWDPSGSPGASTSPAPSLDAADIKVCEATLVLADGVRRMRDVELRRNGGRRLSEAFDTVLAGRDMLMQRYPARMRTRVRTLDIAITNMALAVEDLETTPASRIGATIDNIRTRITGLRRAIVAFQGWVGCEALAATDEPAGSGTPDVSGAPTHVTPPPSTDPADD